MDRSCGRSAQKTLFGISLFLWRTSMMGCEALISSVFFDAMYEDMVLSRSAYEFI